MAYFMATNGYHMVYRKYPGIFNRSLNESSLPISFALVAC